MLEDSVILREPEHSEGNRRIGPLLGRSFALLRMTVPLLVILSTFAALSAGCAKDLSAQLPGQSFTVTPDTAAATVGDSVTLYFRIHLHERDQLLDSIPQVVGSLPPGVRVLAVGRLARSPSRVFEGRAQLAFYRAGRRAVPLFGLPFMRIVEGVSRGTVVSDSAFVEIRAVLSPAGNPALKDIRELEPRPASAWPLLALAAALLAAAGLYLRSRRRKPATDVVMEQPEPQPAVPPGAYDVAVERLNRLEAEQWPQHGDVARHYDAVAQILRQYLEEAHDVGALERTTAELLWAIPPHLGRGGLRDQCHGVLAEADLVKFAKVRPSIAAANGFLERSRQLLAAWHSAPVLGENAHAVG